MLTESKLEEQLKEELLQRLGVLAAGKKAGGDLRSLQKKKAPYRNDYLEFFPKHSFKKHTQEFQIERAPRKQPTTLDSQLPRCRVSAERAADGVAGGGAEELRDEPL